jgi:diacylglycerol kinase (ATP)
VTRERRAFVLGRHRKGRPIGATVRDVVRDLRAGGWKVESDIVERKGQLRRRTSKAVKDGFDTIVAVGGDGAVGQIATKLVGSGANLGIIPTGTGNLLAGNLRIPHDAAAATQTLLEGRLRHIDAGRLKVDGHRRAFTVACGVGFDADVMEATQRSQKLRWGKLAYLANAVARTSSLHNVPHTLRLDGEVTQMEAAQVFVANFGKMLPLIAPRPPVRPDDGLLDVIVVTASGPLPALLASWEAVRSDGLGESDGGHVFRARAREVRIETEPDRLVELDGSVVGRTPVVASIVPRGLSVIVPAR